MGAPSKQAARDCCHSNLRYIHVVLRRLMRSEGQQACAVPLEGCANH